MIPNSESLRRTEAAAVRFAMAYAEAHARIFPDQKAAAITIDGAVALFAGSDSPVSKCLGIGIGGDFTKRSLVKIEEFYREKGIAPAIEISPLAPASLSAILSGRGYIEEYRLVVMTRDVEVSMKQESVAGIEIVAGNADPEIWARTVAAGFSGLAPELLREIFNTNAAIASVTRWLARVSGEIAGGGALSIDGGVAHLFGTSVLPGFRRRGVQRELLRCRLDFSRRAGSDLAVVVASPGSDSERNLARSGLRVGWERVVMRKG